MSNTLNMTQELKDEFIFINGKENYTLVDGVYLPVGVKVPTEMVTYAKNLSDDGKPVVINVRSSSRIGVSFSVSYINWYPRNQWERTDDSAIIYKVGEEVIHNFTIMGEVDYINKITVEVDLEDLE